MHVKRNAKLSTLVYLRQAVDPVGYTVYWELDETAKIKIYIATAQFNCEITEEMITVNFESESCDISVVDTDGATHVLKFDK